METVLVVLGFLAFIAWRERQHALVLASRRGEGKAPSPVRRRGKKAGPPRVISAEDDGAFNAKKQRQEGLLDDEEGEG